MTNPDDRPAADQNAYTSEDAFAPGGDPRTDVADDVDGADADATDATDDDGLVGPADADDDAPEATQREVDEQHEKYLRLAAEYDNYRKRTLRERQDAGARAQAELVKPMLDALDDLERFAQVDPATATASTVIEGVALVGRKLQKLLATAGLEIVNPQDQPFDPAHHEAIATAPAASPAEDSTVAQVFQPGYMFGGQLLRPARVVVRQWNG